MSKFITSNLVEELDNVFEELDNKTAELVSGGNSHKVLVDTDGDGIYGDNSGRQYVCTQQSGPPIGGVKNHQVLVDTTGDGVFGDTSARRFRCDQKK